MGRNKGSGEAHSIDHGEAHHTQTLSSVKKHVGARTPRTLLVVIVIIVIVIVVGAGKNHCSRSVGRGCSCRVADWHSCHLQILAVWC